MGRASGGSAELFRSARPDAGFTLGQTDACARDGNGRTNAEQWIVMAGIEDLKLWRTEPYLQNLQEFYPKPGLEWKEPFQGRWMAPDIRFPQQWLGPETVIKELDTKFPFSFADEAGQIETAGPAYDKYWGKGFTTKSAKTAADIAKDEALLKEWFPVNTRSYRQRIGAAIPFETTTKMDPEWFKWKDKYFKDLGLTHKEIASLDYANPDASDFYGKRLERQLEEIVEAKGYQHKWPATGIHPEKPIIGRHTDDPVTTYSRQKKLLDAYKKFRIPMTQFENISAFERAQGRDPFFEITPPLDEVNKAKVNLLKSFQQNFMKYEHDPDLMKKNIYSPKTRWEQIKRIPHKISDIWGRYKAGQPIKSGIPWSTVGRSILNNPLTRFVGGAGNVALGGQALLDIGTGSQHTKNMMTDINRFAGVPVDRQGNVIQSNRVYENLQNVAQRDVLNPNEMRGVTSFDTTRYNPREMNTGGIASLR